MCELYGSYLIAVDGAGKKYMTISISKMSTVNRTILNRSADNNPILILPVFRQRFFEGMQEPLKASFTVSQCFFGSQYHRNGKPLYTVPYEEV